MNKLVSKNPILRFKLGRKIVKALFGYKTREDGVIVNLAGIPIGKSIKGSSYNYEKNYPEDKLILPGLYLDNYDGSIYSPNIDGNGDYVNVLNGPSPIKNGTYYETKDASGKVIERGRYFGKKKHPLPIGPSSSNKKLDNSQLSSEENSKPVSAEKRLSTPNKQVSSRRNTILPSSKFYGLTVGGKVLARGSNFNGLINDSLKQALLKAGFKNEDFNNVRSFLNALNNFFLKDEAGSIKADNMWGDQTNKAFELALSKAGYDPSNKIALTPTTISNIYALNRLAGLQAAGLLKKPENPTIVPEGGISNFTPLSTTKTYNRANIRDFIRSKGRSAYDFTGNQRKALRMVLNGQGTDEDLAIVKAMGLFKLGGILPSRNIIKRFKNRKFN